MYCKNCGEQLNEGVNFCFNCGFKAGEGLSYCEKCGFKVKGSACENCGNGISNHKEESQESNNEYFNGYNGQSNNSYNYNASVNSNYNNYVTKRPKSKIAAGILGILLGGLGVHRFYLGYIGIGILQIVVTILTCGAGSLWGFIEGILILCGVTITRDADGCPLADS